MRNAKGKPYAHRRNKLNDNLPTPYSMTQHLFKNEKFDYNKSVLEPACGELAIVDVLINYFNRDISFDDIKGINSFGWGDVEGKDFFSQKKQFNYIITNPPFSLWDKFVEKAKEIAIQKFAFLGDMDFLTGIDRYNKKLYFDGKYGLARVYEFVRKCDLRHELREDGKYPAGMQHYYGWYIFVNGWDKDYYEGRWINNQDDILSSRESTCKCDLCKKDK